MGIVEEWSESIPKEDTRKHHLRSLRYVAYRRKRESARKLEAASGIMLTLLLTSMLFMVFNVELSEAESPLEYAGGNPLFEKVFIANIGNQNMPPTGMASGDFDGDGWLDLATSCIYNETTNPIYVFYNKRDGTFEKMLVGDAGPYSGELALGDFNKDGLTDLATCNWKGGSVPDLPPDKLYVFYNAGNGTFTREYIGTTDGLTHAMTTGDFNRDGLIDLATGSHDHLATEDYITYIFYDAGNGTFLKMPIASGPGSIYGIGSGDFDGDESIDVATYHTQVHGVYISYNNGNGSFTTKWGFSVDSEVYILTSGNFDQDELTDIVTGRVDGPVHIYYNKRNGVFEKVYIGTTDRYTYLMTSGDFNRDRLLDLATISDYSMHIFYYRLGPAISIVSPENKTYDTTDIPLTFTVDESVLWMAYSLDGQANVTITGNTTLSGLSDGSHNLIVYTKDAAGSTGTSEIIYFSTRARKFEVVHEGEIYEFSVNTNSTIVAFDPTAKQISLTVNGSTGTLGTCNITIPKQFVPADHNIEVYIDGQKTEHQLTEDEDNYYVYVEYQHSIHTLTISLVTVAIWMQWWFWLIVAAGIIVLAGTVYFLKRRQLPPLNAPSLPSEKTGTSIVVQT